MIRMIGLDLDGTLLTADKRISEENKKTLYRASEQGITIVPVTGRPYFGIPASVMELPFIRYAITSNGAVTTDRAGGGVIRERCMTAQKAAEVLSKARESDIIREYFTGGYGHHDLQGRRLLKERFGNTPVMGYLRQSRILEEDLMQSLGAQPGGIENLSIMCRSESQKYNVLGRIRHIEGIRIIFPWPTDLEITSNRADKGEALLDLCTRLGISREETMAIGDGNNDLGLMRAAGFSVAMGNSDEDVKEAADFVTNDNEHDGVAAAIIKHVL